MEFTGPEHDAGTPPGTRAPSDASSGHSGAAASGEARYRECLRNHAAAQGGHAVDGCGEFMPAGAHDLLRCAACGCHRSFHRRDDGQHLQHPHLFLPAPAATRTTVPRVPLLMPPPQHHPYAAGHPHAPPFAYNPHHHHYQRTPSGGGTTTESSSEEPGPGPPSTSGQGHGQAQRRKRFRTRFTAEQRGQMLALAERVGWRMLKQDEALVEQLCAQAGVRRQVFKVWMHNNKHHRRQPQPPQSQQQQQQQQTKPWQGTSTART